jgi:hypothetical protein
MIATGSLVFAFDAAAARFSTSAIFSAKSGSRCSK